MYQKSLEQAHAYAHQKEIIGWLERVPMGDLIHVIIFMGLECMCEAESPPRKFS